MSAFWDWAVQAYARPGAAEACLTLQDQHGQNVPLVLWVVWCARTGRSPDASTLAKAAETASAWEAAATAPLRAARRNLKQQVRGIPDEDRLAFRERVKALELAAERLLMEALESLSASSVEQPEDRLLSEAATAYGAPLPPEAFAPLLVRL